MILEVKDGCFGYFGQPVIFDHINLSLEKGHMEALPEDTPLLRGSLLDAQALRAVGLYEHSDPDDLSGDA